MEVLMLHDNETVSKIVDHYKNENQRLTEERRRFLAIAYNAIVLGQLDEIYDKEQLLDELGCSEEEYDEIMG